MLTTFNRESITPQQPYPYHDTDSKNILLDESNCRIFELIFAIEICEHMIVLINED